MRTSLLFLPTLLAVLAAPLTAQRDPGPAELLADVGNSSTPSGFQSDFVEAGGWSYFVASVDSSDRVYRTAGTAATTERFFDVDPATQQRISFLRAAGGRIYFLSQTTPGRGRLWSSDGTVAGTRVVLGSTSAGVRLDWAAALGNQLVFGVDGLDGAGSEPWITDGSVAGTRRILDLTPGPDGTEMPGNGAIAVPSAGSSPERVWFQVLDRTPSGTATTRYLSTDGTAAGTQTEAHFSYRQGTGIPTVLGTDRIAYATFDPNDALHLVSIERGVGTIDLLAPPAVSRNERALTFDGRAFFGAFLGTTLMTAFDGAAPRTITLVGGSKQGASLPLGERGGILFIAYQIADRSWRLAELPAGSATATDIGPLPGAPASLLVPQLADVQWIGNQLLLALTTSTGRSMFALDVLGSRPVQSTGLYEQRGIARVGALPGLVLFAGVQRPQQSLWVTDGTPAGTLQIEPLQGTNNDPDSGAGSFTPFGKSVLFVGGSRRLARNPWITDGTPTGTRRLEDLQLPDRRNETRNFVAVDDEFWTDRRDPTSQFDWLIEAWNPSRNTRRSVANFSAFTNDGPLTQSAPLGNSMVLVTARTGLPEVVRLDSDGTLTQLLAVSGSVQHVEPLGEQVLFVVNRGILLARAVYVTDGTPAGTILQGFTGLAVNEPISVARFSNRAWISDADGTWELDDNGIRLFAALPANLTLIPAAHQMFGYSDNRLLVTDGTAAGTVSLLTGARLWRPESTRPVALGHRLLFASFDVVASRAWVSDGTLAGTQPLADAALGETEFWVTGPDRALFPVGSSSPRTEARGLFVTDGTPAGTRWLQNLPIVETSGQLGIAHDGKVIVMVQDPAFGEEPFVLDARFGADTHGVPCAGQGFGTANLRATASPVLGSSLDLVASGAGAGLGWFLISPATARPRLVPGTRCATELDLLSAFVSTGQTIGAGGRMSWTLQVPNVPALSGLRLATQAVLATGGGPLGIDISPTVVLTAGR